jgi:tRNA(fMet)-specific endonuclease VapC
MRALLEQKGMRIEDTDLFIAAVALDHDLTLVTHNTRHFGRIPGLRIENWCRPQGQL